MKSFDLLKKEMEDIFGKAQLLQFVREFDTAQKAQKTDTTSNQIEVECRGEKGILKMLEPNQVSDYLSKASVSSKRIRSYDICILKEQTGACVLLENIRPDEIHFIS